MKTTYLQDKNLSYKAKGLLTFLLNNPDKSLTRLRQESKEGTYSINKALQELRSGGYIKTILIRDSSGKLTGSKTNFLETSS